MKRRLEISCFSKEDPVRVNLSVIGLFMHCWSANSRWLSAVGKRYVVAPVLLVLISVISCLVSGVNLYTTVPQALGMGQAYTARARGPLAPLWNPAGISDLPGLHGALAVSFSSEAEGVLLAGGSLVSLDGLSLGLATAQGKDEGQGFGTLAFRILPGVCIGGSLSSVAQTDSRGISFNAGVLVRSSWQNWPPNMPETRMEYTFEIIDAFRNVDMYGLASIPLRSWTDVYTDRHVQRQQVQARFSYGY